MTSTIEWRASDTDGSVDYSCEDPEAVKFDNMLSVPQ